MIMVTNCAMGLLDYSYYKDYATHQSASYVCISVIKSIQVLHTVAAFVTTQHSLRPLLFKRILQSGLLDYSHLHSTVHLFIVANSSADCTTKDEQDAPG